MDRAPTTPPPPAPRWTDERADDQASAPATAGRRLLGATRLVVVVGAVALFAAAVALLAVGAVEAGRLVVKLLAPGAAAPSKAELILSSVELVDLILLAALLYVTAAGLYELFVDARAPVPPWLRVRDLDDLKHKLTAVVITVLGVVFLGRAVSWDGRQDLLPFGAAVAAVVVALTYFLGSAKSGGGDK